MSSQPHRAGLWPITVPTNWVQSYHLMYQNTDIPTRGKFSGSLFAYHSCHSNWCSTKEDITPWNPSSLSSCVMLSQAKSGNQSEIKTFLTQQLFTLYHNTQYARLISHFKQITEWQMMLNLTRSDCWKKFQLPESSRILFNIT